MTGLLCGRAGHRGAWPRRGNASHSTRGGRTSLPDATAFRGPPPVPCGWRLRAWGRALPSLCRAWPQPSRWPVCRSGRPAAARASRPRPLPPALVSGLRPLRRHSVAWQPWVPVLRPPFPEQPPVRSALTLRSASRATSSHRREVRVGPASRPQTRWTPAAPRRPESPHWGPESVSPLGHVSCNIRRYGFALFPRGAPWQPRRSPIPTAAEDGCRFLLQLRTNLRRSSRWRLSSSCGTTAPRCETESTTSSSTRWAAPRPRASGLAHGAHLGEAVPIPQAQPPAAPGEGESRARRAQVNRQALEKP